jgi:hypothetical protein
MVLVRCDHPMNIELLEHFEIVLQEIKTEQVIIPLSDFTTFPHGSCS